MAISYDVCQIRGGSATIGLDGTGGSASVSKTWSTEWQVYVEGVADPSAVDEVMVLNAPGLPRLGTSVYADSQSGQIFPYFSVRNKTATRDEDNAYRFVVTVEYNDESGEEESQEKPADPENIGPTTKISSGSQSATAWDDQYKVGCILPTGTLYSQAITRQVGQINFQHTQYENNFTQAKFTDRLFKANSQTWNGFPAHHALITNISWDPNVEVPIISDPPVTATSNRVTYTISCVDYKVLRLKDNDQSTETIRVGHGALRLLVDDHFLNDANDIKTRMSFNSLNPGAIGKAYLNEDGTLHPVQAGQKVDGKLPPPPMRWHPIQNITPFTFLRGA